MRLAIITAAAIVVLATAVAVFFYTRSPDEPTPSAATGGVAATAPGAATGEPNTAPPVVSIPAHTGTNPAPPSIIASLPAPAPKLPLPPASTTSKATAATTPPVVISGSLTSDATWNDLKTKLAAGQTDQIVAPEATIGDADL